MGKPPTWSTVSNALLAAGHGPKQVHGLVDEWRIACNGDPKKALAFIQTGWHNPNADPPLAQEPAPQEPESAPAPSPSPKAASRPRTSATPTPTKKGKSA